MSGALVPAHFGAMQQLPLRRPRASGDPVITEGAVITGSRLSRLRARPGRHEGVMAKRRWSNDGACPTTAATKIWDRDAPDSPMDAYAERGEAQPLTHRQAMLIVLGVLLPTFMG